MAIRRLKVSNFRSFNELDVELGDFNVLIGANASGKSNFIEILRFLRDIRSGLDDALSLQGGSAYVQNLQIGSSKPLSIELTTEFKNHHNISYEMLLTQSQSRPAIAYVDEVTYGFSLNADAEQRGSQQRNWQVLQESLDGRFSIYPARLSLTEKEVEGAAFANGAFTLSRDSSGFHSAIRADPKVKQEYFAYREPYVPFVPLVYSGDTWISGSTNSPSLLAARASTVLGSINSLAMYRIDPLESQKAQPVRAAYGLTPDGRNLALVLDRILSNDAQRESMLNLVHFLLPFIKTLDVERFSKFTDESLFLHFTEAYSGHKKLHAGLMSEGTIAAIALVVILYFQSNPVVVLEDPDRGMHPKLISRVVEMMKEASKEKQIIVTTHHPEMVRYAGVENLLLVSRDEDGFSQISRPADKTMVKRFLENDIGIDELYVDDLLEV